MKLFGSTTSPFVRKILVAARETGLADRIEYISIATSPTGPDAALQAKNPLAKLPTLVTGDGVTLFDSRVITQYLDHLSGGRLFPENLHERFSALRLESLADGILDAGILVRYETALRPKALQWPDWIAAQSEKVLRGLDGASTELEGLRSSPIAMGTIAVACAIGWLEFRQPVPQIRDGREALFEWYDQYAKREAMVKTMPRA